MFLEGTADTPIVSFETVIVALALAEREGMHVRVRSLDEQSSSFRHNLGDQNGMEHLHPIKHFYQASTVLLSSLCLAWYLGLVPDRMLTTLSTYQNPSFDFPPI